MPVIGQVGSLTGRGFASPTLLSRRTRFTAEQNCVRVIHHRKFSLAACCALGTPRREQHPGNGVMFVPFPVAVPRATAAPILIPGSEKAQELWRAYSQVPQRPALRTRS